MSDPPEIIERGYDAIARRYGSWRDAIGGVPDDEWLGELLAKLPPRARVLELGCGPGDAAARVAAAGHLYSGVDISAEQLRRARERVPDAEFRQADLTEVAFEPGSLDAVFAIHVFNHIPRAKLPGLLERIGAWLRPRGYLLATFGRSGDEGVQEDWLGVPMFFASYTDDETRALVRNADLVIERDEVVTIVEPDEGDAKFLWLLARKQG